MSTDIRELLRSAAEADLPGFGAQAAMQRGTWLRWRRRVQVALPVAVAIVVFLSLVLPRVGSFVDAERISPARPREHETDPSDERVPQTRSDDASAPVRPNTSRPNDGSAAVVEQPKAGSPVDASVGCRPLITDLAGDTERSSIDVLRSRIAYEATTRTLVLTHEMRDIVRKGERTGAQAGTATGTGDDLHYDLHFTWDELEYSAEVWIGQSGEVQTGVVRKSRSYPDDVPQTVNFVDIVRSPIGDVDADTDTVTLRVRLDEFNDGERTASASEGKPPPAALEPGAKLTNISLHTLSQEPKENFRDVGFTDCHYVIAPER